MAWSMHPFIECSQQPAAACSAVECTRTSAALRLFFKKIAWSLQASQQPAAGSSELWSLKTLTNRCMLCIQFVTAGTTGHNEINWSVTVIVPRACAGVGGSSGGVA